MTDDVAESGGNKRTLGLTLAGGLLVGFLIAWLIFRSPGYETIDIGKHVGATSDEVDFVFSYNGCKKPGCTDWPALKLENVPPGFMCSSCGGGQCASSRGGWRRHQPVLCRDRPRRRPRRIKVLWYGGEVLCPAWDNPSGSRIRDGGGPHRLFLRDVDAPRVGFLCGRTRWRVLIRGAERWRLVLR